MILVGKFACIELTIHLATAQAQYPMVIGREHFERLLSAEGA